MTRALFAFLLLLSGSAVCAADDPLAVFNRANEAYTRGDYRQAISLYESLTARGEANAALYYNIGNAYFKDQQIGRAVVNFERAERLAPRDGDIRYNLRYLRGLVKEPALPFFEAAIRKANGLVSLNELLAGVSFCFVAGAGFFILFMTRRAVWSAFAGVLLAGVFLAGMGWVGIKMKYEIGTRWAVVVAGTVEARNGPGADNSVAFSVPEGRKVMILGENNGWYAVALPHEGITGWVEQRAVEPVDGKQA